MTNPNQKAIKLPNGILIDRSISDQNGDTHFRVTKEKKSVWNSVSDLAGTESSALKKMSKAGIPIITQKTKSALKEAVENISVFETGLVAKQPGWISSETYVFPDGSVIAYKENDPVIVTFPPNPNYAPNGTLKEWRANVGPILTAQPTLQFQMCLTFAALLLGVFSPAKDTIVSELIGAAEAGKTTAIAWLGSVYGGNPHDSRAIVRSANATKQAFAGLQRGANDSVLLLDETSGMDNSLLADGQLLFYLTDPHERARYGETAAPDPVRNCVLMTGNGSLLENTTLPPEKAKAARSRLLSFDVGSSVFDNMPEGFTSTGEALTAMRHDTTQNYGVAGPEFVRKLVDRASNVNRAPKLIARIQKHMDTFKEEAISRVCGDYSKRHLEACAITYVAGKLAIGWKILPIKTGELRSSCMGAFLQQSTEYDPVIERIEKVIRNGKNRIVKRDKDLEVPIDTEVDVLAYTIKAKSGATNYWFDQEKLKNELGTDSLKILKSLRERGVLQGETGKLASKPPKCLGNSKPGFRMYKMTFKSDPMLS